MKLIQSIALAFLMFLAVNIQAQDELKEGYLKMEILDVDSEDEAMKAQLSMMKNSIQEIYFNEDGKVLAISDMMGGMVKTTTLTDNKNLTGFMLFNMEMMGQRIKIDLSESIKDNAASRDSIADNIEVNHDYDKTLEILGMKCHEVQLVFPGAGNAKITAYVTNDLKVDAEVIPGMSSKKIGGVPLKYIMSSQGMSFVYEAVDFKNEVDDSVFDINTTGYDEMTMEEFQKTMGAMGGMGF